jgi:hypothetical protein
MRKLLILLLLATSLTGCADATYRLHRALYSVDCRPDQLQPNGQCTPVRK